MALVMVGFLLGEKFMVSSFHRYGRHVLWISIAIVIVTSAVVLLGLKAVGLATETALLLSAIATATAPAATVDVVHEAGADGPFSQTLLGIVAVDDAWGLVLFSFVIAAAQMMTGQGNSMETFLHGAWEIGGAIVLGTAMGYPMAYLTGRVRPGEPTLVEALGVIFLCGGIAIWLDVSYLVAAMVLGAVVSNCARHHTRPFHAIEDIEWPIMIIFFVMAGASLHLKSIEKIGFIGIFYILLRTFGRFVGAWLGGFMSRADAIFMRWMGMALLPQAGVALGMALIASQRFPNLSDTILPVTIGATVIFELAGPIFARMALDRAGEIKKES
jgi:Kef-type K+ transport system membrane component KefB